MFSPLQTRYLDVYGRTNTQDDSGQITEAWAVVYSDVPCRMSEAPKNFAVEDSNYKTTKETFIFFIDTAYDALVTKDNRITYEGKEYYIVKTSTFQGSSSNHHMELYAQIISVGGQSGLQSGLNINLNDYVPVTRRINGIPLDADITLDKTDIGLGNVDNTSDANKPVSTAQQDALDDKQNIGTNYDDLKYSQAFNASTVIVTHNLNKYPSVFVLDSAGDEVVGSVTHNSANQLTIVFSASFSGIVYCN